MTNQQLSPSASPSYFLSHASLLGKENVDILIRDGYFASVTPAGAIQAPKDAQFVDAHGLIALPGLVDGHTHLRQPGGEESETVLTGSQSAALGGYTCVNAMANTTPTQDSSGVVEQVWRLGQRAGYCYVQPVGAVSKGLKGEQLASLGSMARSACRVRYFSDDGMCVSDPVLMRRALEYVKAFDGVIAQHAQDPLLSAGGHMHEGEVSSELGLAPWPAVAEEAIIARDCLLAKHVNSRLHVLHVSTAGSVNIIRQAKSQGMPVTAEATPHHLSLDHTLARSYDARFKVNPPLRSREDVEALRQAVADGTIDVIGTDHAPHPTDAKDCEWACAANGMLGLETALSVIQESLVDPGLISWEDVARLMSYTPARICKNEGFGLPIEEGNPAHMCLYDPHARRVIHGSQMASLSSNTPWEGKELPGKVCYTFFAGKATVWDSHLVESSAMVDGISDTPTHMPDDASPTEPDSQY